MPSKIFTSVFSSDNYRERGKIQEGRESLYDYKQRYMLVNIIIVFGIIMTSVLTPTVLKEGGTVFIAVFQCFLAFLLLVSFLLRRFWGGGSDLVYNFYGKFMPVLVLAFLFGFMYYRGGVSGFVGIWVVIIPIIAIFTLGTKSGTVISALMWIWIFAADVVPGRPEHYYNYGLGTTFRIFGLSLAVWSLSFAYEYMRVKNQGHIHKIVNELFSKNDKIEKQNKTIMDSIKYASSIQQNILPLSDDMAKSFSDYSVIWKPRDVVGGDIYWIKKFDEGTVLCIADCTGHGTPGALLTMLVVSALEGVVKQKNCRDTAEILWKIERRLVDVFGVKDDGCNTKLVKDGCDMAVLFIANDKSVTLSSGHLNVFVCNGESVRRVRGQNIFVGEGKLKSKDEVETVFIEANSNAKFYIASDGLFDQTGGERGRAFGYKNFEKIILENHAESQSVISGKIWDAFEKHRGAEPRIDDFELVTFKP